jgi:hypothetical protein
VTCAREQCRARSREKLLVLLDLQCCLRTVLSRPAARRCLPERAVERTGPAYEADGWRLDGAADGRDRAVTERCRDE